MPRQHKKMTGGIFGWGENSYGSSNGSSVGSTLSSWWSSAKNKLTGQPSTSSYNSSYNASAVGGKTRRKRHMRGGNLAANASPISGVKNAQPHTWVGKGGKTRRQHKCSKSCKHRKH